MASFAGQIHTRAGAERGYFYILGFLVFLKEDIYDERQTIIRD